MDQHIKKVYVPMTETAFFILLCLRKPNHGYGVVQMVDHRTFSNIHLYGQVHLCYNPVDRPHLEEKIYQITDLGLEVLQLERKRIERLYKIAQEEM